jgi:ABC-2 type transport system ATP-binding protein
MASGNHPESSATATTLAEAAAGPAIRLHNISRWFGSTCAVDRVSFEVKHGEVFGFIGPNGAGKTTSMRILATLDMPTEGEAWVDGFSVIDDADRVRRRLGFMPDGFGTYSDVNCEEYLDFFARAYGLRGEERLQSLRHVMGFTQLDQLAHKPVNGLSKGMKQRLCLGRALIHDPQVLILDEPAAGLDPRARIELRDMIRELARNGKSILVSSHILTELAEICDRVAIIEQGRLLAVGSVDDILSGKSTSHESVEPPGLALNQRAQMTVVTLSEIDAAAAWLCEQPEVQSLQRNGQSIRFEYSADPQLHADLLESMIKSGIRVASFASKQRSLEDAFLHVTKGRIQ